MIDSGMLLGFALFAAAGLGAFSFLTGKSIGDLWAGVIAAITGGSSTAVNFFTNYYNVLEMGLRFEDWGFTLLAIATIVFIAVMILNFFSSRNRSFVK